MENKVLVIKTVSQDMTARKGFKYPKKGLVKAPDWDPIPVCGKGLHGLLWGTGDYSLLNWDPDAKWLALEADPTTLVDLKGKVKFPEGEVVCCGDRKTVTDYVRERAPNGTLVIGSFVTTGDYRTSTSGDRGTSTSGDRGTSTSGDRGTSTSGDYGTSTSGDYGTSNSGYGGTSTSGTEGTSTSGNLGTSTSGDWGTSTSGYGGTSTSGVCGTSTSGEGGTLVIKWYNKKEERYMLAVGYVGKNGIKPNVPYVCNENGELVEKK
jgi:hypothetical protein